MPSGGFTSVSSFVARFDVPAGTTFRLDGRLTGSVDFGGVDVDSTLSLTGPGVAVARSTAETLDPMFGGTVIVGDDFRGADALTGTLSGGTYTLNVRATAADPGSQDRGSAGFDVRLDLTPIPEPATTGVLGLAVLALRRRR